MAREFNKSCEAGPPAVELETIEAAAAFEKENRHRMGRAKRYLFGMEEARGKVMKHDETWINMVVLGVGQCRCPVYNLQCFKCTGFCFCCCRHFFRQLLRSNLMGHVSCVQRRLAVLCFCDAPLRSAFERAARQVEEMVPLEDGAGSTSMLAVITFYLATLSEVFN